jgi:cyclase
VTIPVIASGGMGSPEHFVELVNSTGADAVAIASIFHYKKFKAADIRACAKSNGITVRKI